MKEIIRDAENGKTFLVHGLEEVLRCLLLEKKCLNCLKQCMDSVHSLSDVAFFTESKKKKKKAF